MRNNEKTYKRGVTLVALVLVIVTTLILLTVTIVSVNDNLNNANKVAFENDAIKIIDQAKSYLIYNGTLPVTSEEPISTRKST